MLSKCEGLSSNPQHPLEKVGMAMCASVPVAFVGGGVAETAFLGFALWLSGSRFIERPSLEGVKWSVAEPNTLHPPLPPHAHT